MKSLFARILLWFLATIAVTVIGMLVTTVITFSQSRPRMMPYRMLLSVQEEEARTAYEAGGQPALGRTLARFRRRTQTLGSLTDSSGRDLLTGEDRSELIGEAKQDRSYPLMRRNQMVLAQPSEDGRYWYLMLIPRQRLFWFLHPAMLWVLALAVLLCYLLALQLTAPVRHLQAAVERFGRGDFAARSNSKRADELGELGRTFDRMAERIQTLLAAERRLLLDISHELRSPLARLSVAVELARSGQDQQALDRIEKEAERLNSLVGELLQVTRAEGDPSAMQKEDVRLDELVAEIVEATSIEAEARGASIEITRTAETTVRADEELLRRAFENVLRNAIRYAPHGTSVDVSVERTLEAAVIKVRDTGPGVPEEALPRIFDPFYRVESDRSRASGGGAGLGLSIARRAVDLHKGTLKARNANPGLLVEIELPLNQL
jgi:two-component system sensor histidine kinase CpxA